MAYRSPSSNGTKGDWLKAQKARVSPSGNLTQPDKRAFREGRKRLRLILELLELTE